jgi:hypothetical protein
LSSNNSKTRTATVSTSGTNHREGRRPPYFQENEMEKIMEITFAIIGTILTTVALIQLVPEGMWLSLAALVIGPQMIAMAIRSARD